MEHERANRQEKHGQKSKVRLGVRLATGIRTVHSAEGIITSSKDLRMRVAKTALNSDTESYEQQTPLTDGTRRLAGALVNEPLFKSLLKTRAGGETVRIAAHVLVDHALDALEVPADRTVAPSLEAIEAMVKEPASAED